MLALTRHTGAGTQTVFPSSRKTSGMTLLETMVSVAIVTVIMAMIFPTFRMASATMQDGALQAKLDQKAAVVADEIANSIRYAKGSTIAIPPGSVVTSNYTVDDGSLNTTVTQSGITGTGSTGLLTQGGTTIQFQQILGYNTSYGFPTPNRPEGLIVGANLDGGSDDSRRLSRGAIIGSTVSYQYVQLNGRDCLAAYIDGNIHHVLTDELAPVYSYFQQTNKGIKIQVLVQSVNQLVYQANPTASPETYTMYGIASTTVVPEIP